MNDPKKYRTDKQNIKYADHPSDTSTVDENMHECMVPDEPWIGLLNNSR